MSADTVTFGTECAGAASISGDGTTMRSTTSCSHGRTVRGSWTPRQPETMRILFTAPRLEDVWQVHFSELSGQEYTVPGSFIANLFDQPQPAMPVAPMPPVARGTQAPPVPPHDGTAYWLKISAQTDGTFTVTNSRNGFSRTYAASRN